MFKLDKKEKIKTSSPMPEWLIERVRNSKSLIFVEELTANKDSNINKSSTRPKLNSEGNSSKLS